MRGTPPNEFRCHPQVVQIGCYRGGGRPHRVLPPAGGHPRHRRHGGPWHADQVHTYRGCPPAAPLRISHRQAVWFSPCLQIRDVPNERDGKESTQFLRQSGIGNLPKNHTYGEPTLSAAPVLVHPSPLLLGCPYLLHIGEATRARPTGRDDLFWILVSHGLLICVPHDCRHATLLGHVHAVGCECAIPRGYTQAE